jgi:predicted glycosyltransferase
MLGGGQDGDALADAFIHAGLPRGVQATLLAGPYMPSHHYQQLVRLAALRPRLQILRFTPDPLALLQQADLVISMGGYNSVCEILAHRKRALIVPRIKPRQEQWIRAQRLEALGLVDVLHPDKLSSDQLHHWMATADPCPIELAGKIDLDGYARLPHLLRALITEQPVHLDLSRMANSPFQISQSAF